MAKLLMRKKKVIRSLLVVFGCYFLYSQTSSKAKLIQRKANYNWYIVACLTNNAHILDNWTEQLLLLIEELTPDDVFVSIMENGNSRDNTGALLQAFEKKLDQIKIGNKIITNRIIDGPLGRFGHLAAIRNEAMKPLFTLRWHPNMTRIIFLNDIYYKLSDVVNLINTNHMEYDFACGLDFYYAFYDTLVARDSNGKHLMNYYPYFRSPVDQILVRNGLPVRVYSGWNGMVVMQAAPFMEHQVRFRESEVDENTESECYFICKDFWRLGFNRVYINPTVKVAYVPSLYYLHNYLMWPVNCLTDWYYWLRSH